MTDELDEVEGGSGTTRRRVLKKVAIGAGAAWTVPMVFGTSAALAANGGDKCLANAVANSVTHPCTTCPACETGCGTYPGGGQCCCYVQINGCCFCGANAACLSTGCAHNSDCAPGSVCAYTCCSPTVQCV